SHIWYYLVLNLPTVVNPASIKFLATVDSEGKPNAVVIASLVAIDDETLAFADLMINKTKENLLNTKKVAATVYKPAMNSFQVKGTFMGFQNSGLLIDIFNSVDQIRLNTVSNIDSIGLIKVEEVYFAQMPFPGRRIA
ncbi:MAG: pyridoxamine 5'-phosphate oxidase family protein, partial [Candidatus Jordarchaeum sp.]|uniref:pyridoxamine 5'-phosphate oxidase family protein n=1 Tax=Candidatus Jordarchaeum sp. TaxID=2823881 RepID=UPI00404B746B